MGAPNRVQIDGPVILGVHGNGASARLLLHDDDRSRAAAIGRLTRQPHRVRFAADRIVSDVEIDDVTNRERHPLGAGDSIDIECAERKVLRQVFELSNELPDGQHGDPLSG